MTDALADKQDVEHPTEQPCAGDGEKDGERPEGLDRYLTELSPEYLRKLILDHSSETADPLRDELLVTTLIPASAAKAAAELEGLVSLLRMDARAQLQRTVVEATSINETGFFRDLKPFEMIRDKIIPELIRQHAGTRRLRVWCAGCSTGQEAYSVAMVVLEWFPELAGWDVKIVGTDLSRAVVEYALRGRYRGAEVSRGLHTRLLGKYFRRDGDEWEIDAGARKLCEFRVMNLCEPAVSLPIFDLVLLRNVLLYLPSEEREGVFAEVHRQLQPGGYLILGNAEQAEDSTDRFEGECAEECYFYRPAARTVLMSTG